MFFKYLAEQKYVFIEDGGQKRWQTSNNSIFKLCNKVPTFTKNKNK